MVRSSLSLGEIHQLPVYDNLLSHRVWKVYIGIIAAKISSIDSKIEDV